MAARDAQDTPHHLTRREAAVVAVRAQHLDAHRPASVEDVVRAVSRVQLEPTAPVAPSAELVMWSRLGSSFRRQDLWDAVDEQRLVEVRGFLLPPEDVALHRAEMAAWPGDMGTDGEHSPGQRELVAWVEANDACRRDVLDRLRADGPLPSSELPDTCVVPWRSSGWNDDRNLRMMLDRLVDRGEVAAAGGRGRDRLWDLAERVYPDDPVPPLEEARRLLAERRLRALGVSRPRATTGTGEQVGAADAGEPATVEGLRGRWRVDPEQVERLAEPLEGRAVLLSPFDRLLQDRRRMTEVFGFEYVLEMYKPVARRRWGYYALPVLLGERLVGKLDAKAERDEGVLVVHALHEDEPLTAAERDLVLAEVADLATWLDLDVHLEDGALGST